MPFGIGDGLDWTVVRDLILFGWYIFKWWRNRTPAKGAKQSRKAMPKGRGKRRSRRR